MHTKPDTLPKGEQNQQEAEPQPPKMELTPSPSRMELELIFRKVEENTCNPEPGAVMAAMAALGVKCGVNEVAIQALCQTPIYNRSMVVARGTAPGKGVDGYLRYLVEEARELKPKLREDGTADYRDLGFIQNVRKGQPLCEIHKPQKGADGFDIFGRVLEGALGREPKDPKGKNTEYNEDGTLLVAATDGSAEVQRGMVKVVDVMRIQGNVDNSTGDIHFVGDVIVGGDVVSGFRVTSEGSVTVKGSVEGATITAAGDIVVGMGINGMGRGSLVAGGSVRCRYIQSCHVQTGGNIYADSIMYCTLECSGDVELDGKRAVLIGGRSSIAGNLTAKTIGTDSHIATYITMAATGTGKNQEILNLGVELKRLDAENEKLRQILARCEDLARQGRMDAEKEKTLLLVKQKLGDQVEERIRVEQRLEVVKGEQLEASRENSHITCKERVHVGVQITFGPLTMNVQNSFVYSRVSIVGNEITASPLS